MKCTIERGENVKGNGNGNYYVGSKGLGAIMRKVNSLDLALII